MENHYTIVKARRDSVPYPQGCDAGDNYILVNLTVYRTIGGRASRECPLRWDSQTVQGQQCLWIDLPKIKQDPSPYRSRCTRIITEFLSTKNIPEDKLALAIDKLFILLDDSVSPDLPINVDIYDVTVHVESYTPNRVGATGESIEALERVRLDRLQLGDSCAICWLDYDREDQLAIRLPCSHYFHGDCILQWLQINHVCPMCRFAMPTVEVPQPSQPSS